MSDLRVEPLGAGNIGAWEELFARASSACFCRWWHFDGKKNDWLARCASEPGANRAEAEGAVRTGSDEALGLVALREAQVVGWMKIARRASVPKLRGLPLYRGADLGPDAGVWSIGCVLVDPAHRRRRVAEALLDAAPAFVRARGGIALEAYPRHALDASHARLHDEEAWMGPESLFTRRGFARVAEGETTAMYPVYRLAL